MWSAAGWKGSKSVGWLLFRLTSRVAVARIWIHSFLGEPIASLALTLCAQYTTDSPIIWSLHKNGEFFARKWHNFSLNLQTFIQENRCHSWVWNTSHALTDRLTVFWDIKLFIIQNYSSSHLRSISSKFSWITRKISNFLLSQQLSPSEIVALITQTNLSFHLATELLIGIGLDWTALAASAQNHHSFQNFTFTPLAWCSLEYAKRWISSISQHIFAKLQDTLTNLPQECCWTILFLRICCLLGHISSLLTNADSSE